MAAEPQRMVVITDASKDVCANAIKKAMTHVCPQPGDVLTLIGYLDHFLHPLGCMVSVGTTGFISTNDKIVKEEFARKREDYRGSKPIMKLREYCETMKMEFHIDGFARPFIEVASYAARSLGATWLIVDRHVNKYERPFDKLPCGLYRIRNDNSIEKLRDPEVITKCSKSVTARKDTKMIVGNPSEDVSSQKTGHRLSASEHFASTGTSSSSLHEFMKDRKQEVQNIEFINPLCSVCKSERPKVGWKKDFRYTELWKATQGFSPKNFLSEGGFGSVYRAELNGITVAVKKLNSVSSRGEKEFNSEVSLLSRARHENVVMLLGSCSEGKRRLLVYEYVCNGSLDQHLSQHSRFPLSWEERIKVAIGVAKGLLYLHENDIIHKDVRPNNILITHDHQALLGDFGLARNQHEDSTHSTEVIGSLEYMAPEFVEYGKVSGKTDVYSFGVVLIELITGMRTTDKRLEGKSLVGWARPLIKQRNFPELIDRRIINSLDFDQLFWMIRIARKCLTRNYRNRLNMISVSQHQLALTPFSQSYTSMHWRKARTRVITEYNPINFTISKKLTQDTLLEIHRLLSPCA